MKHLHFKYLALAIFAAFLVYTPAYAETPEFEQIEEVKQVPDDVPTETESSDQSANSAESDDGSEPQDEHQDEDTENQEETPTENTNEPVAEPQAQDEPNEAPEAELPDSTEVSDQPEMETTTTTPSDTQNDETHTLLGTEQAPNESGTSTPTDPTDTEEESESPDEQTPNEIAPEEQSANQQQVSESEAAIPPEQTQEENPSTQADDISTTSTEPVPEITATIRIEGYKNHVLPKTEITFGGCEYVSEDTTIIYETPVTYCALKKVEELYGIDFDFSLHELHGISLDGIANQASGFDDGFWVYMLENQTTYMSGWSYQEIAEGDVILVYQHPSWPTTIASLSADEEVLLGSTVTFQAEQLSLDASGAVSIEPISRIVTFLVNGEAIQSDRTGSLSIPFDTLGEHTIQIADHSAVRSEEHTISVYERSVMVRIEKEHETVLEETPITFDSCTFFDETTSTTLTYTDPVAYCALKTASEAYGFDLQLSNTAWGISMDGIAGSAASEENGYWLYAIEDKHPYSLTGISSQVVEEGEHLIFYQKPGYNSPLTILHPNTTTETAVDEEISVQAYSWSLSFDDFNAAPEYVPHLATTTFEVDGVETQSNDQGLLTLTFSTPGEHVLKITDATTIRSEIFNILVSESTVVTEQSGNTTPSQSTNTGGGSGGGNGSSNSATSLVSDTDINEAVNTLLNVMKAHQGDDGSIQDANITDWTILSFDAHKIDPDSIEASGVSLAEFAKNYTITQASEGGTFANLCASYPRHLMSLLSVDVATNDPLVTDLATIMKSDACFDGTYYGVGGGLVNDDIFALIALLSAGESVEDTMIQKMIADILAAQDNSGGFSMGFGVGSDGTGAAINALKYAQQKGASIDATVFSNATDFLRTKQLNDGGWNDWKPENGADIITTSWVTMGINALGQSQSDWSNTTGKNPWHPLTEQVSDSLGYESAYESGKTDWFGLKHAVPALLGKSWPIVEGSEDSSLNDSAQTTTDTAPQAIGGGGGNGITGSGLSSMINTDASILSDSILNEESIVDTTQDTDVDESLSIIKEEVPHSSLTPVDTKPEYAADITTTDNTEVKKEEEVNPTSVRVATYVAPTKAEVVVVEVEPTLEPTPETQKEVVPTAELTQENLIQRIARKIFNSTAVASIALGSFIGLRYLKTLV